MSNIRVDTFSPSGGGTAKSLRGIAAAWANLNGSGTIILRDSQNVSSAVDNGTGDYSLIKTSSLTPSNYAAALTTVQRGGSGSPTGNFSVGYGSSSLSSSPSTFDGTTTRFYVQFTNGGATDMAVITAIFMGDLA